MLFVLFITQMSPKSTPPQFLVTSLLCGHRTLRKPTRLQLQIGCGYQIWTSGTPHRLKSTWSSPTQVIVTPLLGGHVILKNLHTAR